MRYACEKIAKGFQDMIRSLKKIYLRNVDLMWPTLKNIYGLAQVMKALMRDFPDA